jgi:aminomethyltransferase
MTVSSGGEAVGEVTSGGFSFSLGHGIATAYVAPDHAEAPLTVELRGETVPARRVPLPFYRRGRSEGRTTL